MVKQIHPRRFLQIRPGNARVNSATCSFEKIAFRSISRAEVYFWHATISAGVYSLVSRLESTCDCSKRWEAVSSTKEKTSEGVCETFLARILWTPNALRTLNEDDYAAWLFITLQCIISARASESRLQRSTRWLRDTLTSSSVRNTSNLQITQLSTTNNSTIRKMIKISRRNMESMSLAF